MPKTVEKIELSNMPKLKIIIDKENPYIKMKNGAVYSKDGKVMYTLINNKKIYKISNGTETISFNNELDDTVEKIILPSSAEKITENGFSACVLLVVRLNMEKESPIIEDTAFKNTKNGIKFYVKNQIVADQLKEQLKGSGVRNAKILVGKKVVYKNVK